MSQQIKHTMHLNKHQQYGHDGNARHHTHCVLALLGWGHTSAQNVSIVEINKRVNATLSSGFIAHRKLHSALCGVLSNVRCNGHTSCGPSLMVNHLYAINNCHPLDYGIIQGQWIPMFQTNILPPSSE